MAPALPSQVGAVDCASIVTAAGIVRAAGGTPNAAYVKPGRPDDPLQLATDQFAFNADVTVVRVVARVNDLDGLCVIKAVATQAARRSSERDRSGTDARPDVLPGVPPKRKRAGRTTRNRPVSQLFRRCRRRDSNPRHADYDSAHG